MPQTPARSSATSRLFFFTIPKLIAKPELIERGGAFAITIALDPEARTLTVSDNGVGITREDLTEALGTIARSGTKAFLDKLAAEDS